MREERGNFRRKKTKVRIIGLKKKEKNKIRNKSGQSERDIKRETKGSMKDEGGKCRTEQGGEEEETGR